MGSRTEVRDETDNGGQQDGVCELGEKQWVSLPRSPFSFPYEGDSESCLLEGSYPRGARALDGYPIVDRPGNEMEGVSKSVERRGGRGGEARRGRRGGRQAGRRQRRRQSP